MTRRLTEQKIIDLVRDLEFEPLKITVEKQVPKATEPAISDARGDMLLNIAWRTGAGKFVADVLGQATPKQIETRILRLAKDANSLAAASGGERRGKNRFYPLIIAPFLNEKTLNRLAEAEISGIDLSGNGVVVVPDKLFIYRTGEKNKFLSNAPIKNIFRGTSSLVARVFFARPEYENVGEVLEEITRRGGKTTFSTVSKVLKTLEEELIISKGKRIRLLDAKKLLDELRKNYRRPQNDARRITGKVGDVPSALKKMFKNADAKKVLYARSDPAKYAAMPSSGESTVKIYAESVKELLSGVDFTETSRFPNIEFIETDDPTVYFDRRRDDGFYWISPLRTYLELANEGKREQEAANQMLQGLLGFKF
jgi:hypothetical protein